jgi:AcrR family transcriptional regulator
MYTDTNRKKRRPPHKINYRERQQSLPRRSMCRRSIHTKLYQPRLPTRLAGNLATMVYTVYMKAIPTSQKIHAAARRLLDKEGADAVTMRRVAAAVGITAMAVYRHYPDRTGLLNALADTGFQELAARQASARFSGTVEQRLKKTLEVFFDFALQNPRLFELMFFKPREGALQFPQDFKAGQSPTANLTAKLIQEGIQTGLFRDDDVWEITFEMGALILGLIMLYLGGRMAMSPTRFRSFFRRSFTRYIHGIRK